MNFTKKCVAAVALFVMSAVSYAETKIAVINPEGAIFSTAAAKARFEKLEKTADYAATKAKLDAISADLKALQDSANKEGATWSAEKKGEVGKKMQGLQQDGQFNAKKLQTSRQEVAESIAQELGQKYQAALKQVVDAEKIGLLLNGPSVIFATPEYDITAKVTDLINKAK
ncbi:MAG: OmpH family outer membrane protein [Cellvibrio sp.]